MAAPPAPAAPAPPDALELKVLRRLVPSRVALSLDLWKAGPSRDLLDPFDRAESLFDAKDYRGADSALDQLSVRFAEPRWPTLPEPFRGLRVQIPQPQPPHYDPEFALPAEEKEARRLRREAEHQLGLLKASLAWASAHGVDGTGLPEELEAADAAYRSEGAGAGFWDPVDRS
ncbi:MAG TPA: hypothetical protein VGS18_00995, partial [Thermoplasmata archaeon]|nr:hypothetical protein [Thermoplasmata archaeon]